MYKLVPLYDCTQIYRPNVRIMVINTIDLLTDWLIDLANQGQYWWRLLVIRAYVILQLLLFRWRLNEVAPQMTSSLLPWKRFGDMTFLEENGRCRRNVSTFRRLIQRISSIRRNINMKFDERTCTVWRQIDLQWKNQHKVSLRAESHRKLRLELKKFDIRRKTAPLQTKIDQL